MGDQKTCLVLSLIPQSYTTLLQYVLIYNICSINDCLWATSQLPWSQVGWGGCCLFFFAKRAPIGPLSPQTQQSREALGGQGQSTPNHEEQQKLP